MPWTVAELCRALSLEELLEDERFEGPVNRYRNSEVLAARLQECIATRSLADWEKELAGRTLIWAPTRTLAEAVADPQAQEAGIFQTTEHPTAGDFLSVAPPVQMSGFDLRSSRPAPGLGEDSTDVLAEAGLTPQDIEKALASD